MVAADFSLRRLKKRGKCHNIFVDKPFIEVYYIFELITYFVVFDYQSREDL